MNTTPERNGPTLRQKPSNSEETLRILRAISNIPKSVYYPSDDSFLMLHAISNIPLQGKRVLDIGTGSGILAVFCALRGARVTATDIDKNAPRQAEKVAEALGVEVRAVISDLFQNVPERFHYVLFNPPYVPSEGIVDKAIDAGPMGRILIERFLRDLPSHLEPDGTAFLLVSSINKPDSVVLEHPEFQFRLLAKRRLFFEQLQVLGLRFREDFAAKGFQR